MRIMAHAGSGPADLEAQRAELEAVLRSDHFSRAPMLARLLSYLCQKLLAGEARQIKEYSIGLEVFQRGDSFDQNSDSIVRVEANRLRKRLAAYYASDGAAHRLQITIPLGQYVPEFRTVAAPGEEKDSPDGANSPAAAQPRVESAAASRSKPGIDLSGRGIWWLVVALALLLLGPSYAVLIFRQMKQAPPAEVSNQAASPLLESQFGPPAGEEVRILAGSSRGFVDHADKLWNADAWFEGGTEVKSSAEQIWRTQNPVFYRTSRQGQFSYAIPLKKGVYELRLHFAETVYGLDATGTGGEGRRIMTVRANGRTLVSRFDIVADAGASLTADVKVFPGITPAADGVLHLAFTGEDGTQAILSAIEILPGFRTRIRSVRILARQTPYYSNDSRWWSPDDYFEGGQWASYTTPVRGTDDPELYETERWGNFSYAIPVSPGSYSLTLLFAVRHGDWDQASSPSVDDRAPVAHVFNLFCNGVVLLKNFNLAEEVSGTDVVTRRFTGLEPNAQGKLLLSFVPVDGYATVTGIEVIPE
jgi:hypothetical protein